VAEHALWLMGAAAKRLPSAAAAVRAGGWPAPASGRELAGLTLGVVGCGGIGRALAARARGLGMRVLACGATAPAALAAREGVQSAAALPAALGVDAYTDDADAVFAGADVVALTLASSPATRHFVDARRLALMRRGALLVNVARGAVVDEAALFDACAAGAVDAALDVFEVEPYAPVAAGKDLRTLDNVLMTPHIGSNTAQANRNMAEAALANVRAFLAGDFQKVARVY
jgi:phosphoglycerate dehydrogenase-like enzyme